MQSQVETEIVAAINRISKILAGLLLKDVEEADQGVKIKRLKGCGFSNVEIAEMLHTTPNTVGVAVHALRNKKARRAKKKR